MIELSLKLSENGYKTSKFGDQLMVYKHIPTQMEAIIMGTHVVSINEDDDLLQLLVGEYLERKDLDLRFDMVRIECKDVVAKMEREYYKGLVEALEENNVLYGHDVKDFKEKLVTLFKLKAGMR